MTWEGRNLDIASGVLALLLGYILRRGTAPTWTVWAWNVAGLLLLINVVAIAILSLPHSGFITRPPYVWLPTFLVQLALFGHLLVFRKLLT